MVMVFVGVPAVLPASAQGGDPRAERDKVRAEKADVASEVDALQADAADVRSALSALDDNVRGQQAAYSDAQRRADDAQHSADVASAAVDAKRAEIAALKVEVAEFAVNAYVNPPAEDFLDGFREDSANDAARKRELLSLRSGRNSDVLDRLRAAEAELDAVERDAQEAQDAAEQRLSSVSALLSQLQQAQAQQQNYANEVEGRLDAKLAEAANLASTDATLSEQISKQEAELAAQVRSSKPPAPGGGEPRTGTPITPIPGPPGLTSVGGITVNSRIAGNLQSLLSAADAAGISLSGSGYRDSSGQIELRRQNCGTSDYAIYQMPPSQCSPETARPGMSKHEQGLAVDFTSGGTTLKAGSVAHQWMVANAGIYGWVPLAGEPWHWSVGGG